MARAYLGLGSNLEDPAAQLRQAINTLATTSGITLRQVSGLYRSPALLKPGAPPQPDFVNAVAAIDTASTPLQLLHDCQAIEQQQGRVRGPTAWAPRTLDIDILLYDQEVINIAALNIPHPGLAERNFVLYPLFEIAPDLILPQHGPLKRLLAQRPRGELERITEGLMHIPA